MPARKTYSVLIAWDDGDMQEQGSFGWTGRARDADDAEDKARRAMWRQEQTGRYPKKDPPYGSVIELQEGAIWHALDLERTLRDVLKASRRPAALAQAFERARNVLNSIDRAGD